MLRRANPGYQLPARSHRGAASRSISTPTSPTCSKSAARDAPDGASGCPTSPDDDYVMRYRGLDNRERRARDPMEPRPDRGGQNRAMWMLSLEPMATASVDVSVVVRHRWTRPASATDISVRPRAGDEEGAARRRRLTRSAVSSRARARFSTAGSIGRLPTCRS